MLKYILFILLFISVFCSSVSKAQDTVKFGVEVTSVSGIDVKSDSYSIDFLLWLYYKNDSLDVLNSIDIAGARNVSKSFIRKDKIGSSYRVTAKVSADMRHNWDVRHFPFVTQDVKIRFVEVLYDLKQMVLIADSVNSKINSNVSIKAWNITSFGLSSGSLKSESNLGDPNSGGLEFSTGIISLQFERKSPLLIIEKMLLPVWVAFLVSLSVFWIKPINVDPRFGLPGAGLFAAVANKYLISDITIGLPYQVYVETIHNHTFFAILIIIVISVISLKYCEEDKTALYKKIDKYSFFLILGAYILDNIVLLLTSYNQSR